MVTEKIQYNAEDISLEIDWLDIVLTTRSLLNNNEPSTYADVHDIPLPVFTGGLGDTGSDTGSSSDYADFIIGNNLGFNERLVLILSIVPHVRPEILDSFLLKNDSTQQIFTEY